MHQFRLAFYFATLLSVSSGLFAQQIRILSTAAIRLPDNGKSSWYGIEADPANPNDLIVCGMDWNAQNNANYGYIYSSQDGGATWHAALEDKSSRWVSEESCAFGVNGVAYFTTEASKIDDAGMLHHDHGTTHIWVSHNGGRSWTLGASTGWADFAASVVDQNPGPNQNRLYIFFNNLWAYYTSISDKGKPANLPKHTDKVDAFNTAGSTIGLLNYKDGGDQVSEPIFYSGMYKLGLSGSYPGQNLMLKDGSLLTLFWSKSKTFDDNGKPNGRELIFGAQHTDQQRKSMSEPVFIQKAIQDAQPGQAAWKCSSYLSSPIAYDPKTNTVYATYLDGSNGKCSLLLKKSSDNGHTWSSSTWTEKGSSNNEDSRPPEHDYRGLAIARRDDGTLALLWSDSDKPNTWLFAFSTDDGKTYSTPQQISVGGRNNDGYSVTSESLDFYIGQAREAIPTDDAGLRIDNHAGAGTIHTRGIAVTVDGVFHPVWTANGGQVYTAAIAVTKPYDRSKPAPVRTDGWQYETNKVKFTYGGSQRYDEKEAVLTESVVVRNSGTETLKDPLRLEVTPNSRVGVIYPLDAATEGSGDSIAQYLDVGQYIPGDGLAPGASSAPIPLRFRFEPYADARQRGSVANVSLRLLTKGQEK